MTEQLSIPSLGMTIEEHRARVRQKMTQGFNRGPWHFKPKEMVIEHCYTNYWVRVSEFKDSANILDWIAQVAIKTGAYNDAEVGQFVRLINEIIPLQQTVCGMGQGKEIDPVEMVAHRAKVGL